MRRYPISAAVVDAVSEAVGEGPTSLAPLAERIDPDALESLFDDSGGPNAPAERLLVFRYCGCTVAVDGDGEVSVTREAVTGADPNPAR
jgi:hypothetical protein